MRRPSERNCSSALRGERLLVQIPNKRPANPIQKAGWGDLAITGSDSYKTQRHEFANSRYCTSSACPPPNKNCLRASCLAMRLARSDAALDTARA